jgi:hypothetical protein
MSVFAARPILVGNSNSKYSKPMLIMIAVCFCCEINLGRKFEFELQYSYDDHEWWLFSLRDHFGGKFQLKIQYTIDDHESFTVFALKPFWRKIQIIITVYHRWSWMTCCFRFETILVGNSNSKYSIPLMIMNHLLFSLRDHFGGKQFYFTFIMFKSSSE